MLCYGLGSAAIVTCAANLRLISIVVSSVKRVKNEPLACGGVSWSAVGLSLDGVDTDY
jgi:hypothetical protein